MEIIRTSIRGLNILENDVFNDDRGYFTESYNKKLFNQIYPSINFVQDNESYSVQGVLRGLHFQTPPYEQSKLVRAVVGEILDVAVDLRKESKTYGQHEAVILNGEKKNQLLVPKGFAHGFIVLSEYAIVNYKVDNYYAPHNDSGILFNDASLSIDWMMPKNKIIVSEK